MLFTEIFRLFSLLNTTPGLLIVNPDTFVRTDTHRAELEDPEVLVMQADTYLAIEHRTFTV